jgi:uncharacterized delta-60 repeat protein
MKYFSRKTRHLRENFLFGFLAVGLFLVLPALTFAAPGDLDLSFGNGGKVITGSFPGYLAAFGMAIQSDGKIVVVGEGVGNGYDFAVVRYNPNGSLDTSFGGTGIVITPVGDAHEQAASVAIQADGKIVVAGISCIGVGMCSGANRFAIVRYNPNGSLDTSFGGTGKVFTSFGGSVNTGSRLAIQADGKIVAVGNLSNGPNFGGSFVIRYNSNGSLDTSFNSTGIIITPSSVANSVVIQTDGKVVVAGRSSDGLGRGFTIFRYNTDGSPDTSFNGTGKTVTQIGNDSGAGSVAIQADGKIVAAGSSSSNNSNYSLTLVRYNTNGSLDTSFGGTGKIIIQINVYANSVAIQADGKIVVTGNGANDTGSGFAVVRLNPNGSLDTTFNGTGKVITPLEGGATAGAIQADGKIVVAGFVGDLEFFGQIAVVRYQGGSNANIRTRFDFDGDGRADISVFRPSDRTWYLNQSTNGLSATQFGLSTDKITPADYDGDGKTDIAVYRDGFWYWLNSSNGNFNAIQFGVAGDIPQPADYTGDGRAELAVYRGGVWFTLNLANNQINTVQFGIATDKPVVADYDGDGRADYAVYRDGTWHLRQSTQGLGAIQFGILTDRLVPADYDGDGKTDVAVYRDGTWYLLRSQEGFTAFQFGLASDVPAPADYDGDGKSDAAVYRDGIWYLRQSASGISGVQFGLTNDKPVPAAYLP